MNPVMQFLGIKVIPKLINTFNTKYILSSTVGGEAEYSVFLNKLISVERLGYGESLNVAIAGSIIMNKLTIK